MRMPSLFISHESPYLWDMPSAARFFLSKLAGGLPKPRAILLVSAHWNTQGVVVSSAEQPETIYDFGGFPEHYYKIKYPAAGSRELAERVVELTRRGGVVTNLEDRGLDHAAWVPLGVIYPAADIPIVSLSVQPRLLVRDHIEVGRMLQLLRDEGVMIVGSGTATHNLRAFFGVRPPEIADPPADYARAFADWLKQHIDDIEAISDYRKLAPFAAQNHPTPEHFLPLAVALGAGLPDKAVAIHDSFNFGHFSMLSFRWG